MAQTTGPTPGNRLHAAGELGPSPICTGGKLLDEGGQEFAVGVGELKSVFILQQALVLREGDALGNELTPVDDLIPRR